MLLAFFAMAWSQLVYAVHGGCLMGSPAEFSMPTPGAASMNMPMAANTGMSTQARDHHCDAGARRVGEAGCVAHCDQKTNSAEVARVPPVPALLPSPLPAVSSSALKSCARLMAVGAYAAPQVRPRGPTRHPAALLLI